MQFAAHAHLVPNLTLMEPPWKRSPLRMMLVLPNTGPPSGSMLVQA